jgi:hypothetical protein
MYKIVLNIFGLEFVTSAFMKVRSEACNCGKSDPVGRFSIDANNST